MTISSPGPVPTEAIHYFRNKVNVPGFDYRDIWKDEHAHAFTVAKAMQMDVLTSIRDSLDKALANGQTFRQFAKDLTPTLQNLGWWGKAEMTDPVTGETVDAQLGSPRRLQTIYDANMRTARAAGQWERIERTKDAMPYLLYELGPSRDHRKEHVSWAGTLLPVDDPWWGSHMPPNGYGCKCRVRQVSKYEAKQLEKTGVPDPEAGPEIDPETGLPTGHTLPGTIPVKTTAPPTKMVSWENQRTGVVEDVPAGIDPGWNTNPGKVRQKSLEDLLAGKIDGLTEPERTVAIRDLASSGRFEQWVDAVFERNQPKGEKQIIGVIDSKARDYVERQGITLKSDVIMIDDKGLLHSAGDRKQSRGAALGIDDLRNLPVRLLDAECFWDQQDPALVYAFDASDREGKTATAVVRVNYRQKGTTTNRIVTTGLVQPSNMGDPRYVRIEKA